MTTYDAHARYASDREDTEPGLPCEFCGERAVDRISIVGYPTLVPICEHCDRDIRRCPSCEEWFVEPQGRRVVSFLPTGGDLVCGACWEKEGAW
jgi:hypothetical protein